MKRFSSNKTPLSAPSKLQRGFTLIELMITMLVIIIVLAVGVPSLSAFTGARAVRAQVGTLAISMRLARSEAVKRGTRVTVCASQSPESATPSCDGGANWQTGWIMFTDRGVAATIDAGDQIIRVQGLIANSGQISANGGPVSFLPTGIALGGQRRFNFYPKGHSVGDPGDFALALCQTTTGSTRVNKYAEPC